MRILCNKTQALYSASF